MFASPVMNIVVVLERLPHTCARSTVCEKTEPQEGDSTAHFHSKANKRRFHWYKSPRSSSPRSARDSGRFSLPADSSKPPQMDAQPPTPPPMGNGNGMPPGKGNSQDAGQQQQQLVELFGSDMYTAMMALVLLLLGLMSASMTRCVCV